MVILSINAGSSSLKVSVYDHGQLESPHASHAVEEISTFDAAVEEIKTWLSTEVSVQPEDIEAIGHRVVHGGNRYTKASVIDAELLGYLESITPLAPNHMPATLTALRAFQQAYPNTTQVACFDTSFFHDIPDVAKTLPIPLGLQREHNIRRYGFHGLSYQYLLSSFEKHEGEAAAKGRVIMAHLGSGASIAACKDGAPIDMSMGFTPVSGIMMSTRSGDLEPGIATYLQTEHGMSASEVANLFTHKSGLLGVSASTADMYTLLQTQHDDQNVALALDLFCYKISKTIGGYIAALGGVDSIIFSGGIGERSAEIRARILQNFGFAGVELDTTRNEAAERLISSEHSKVGVHVIPAQEDYSIITQTIEATK